MSEDLESRLSRRDFLKAGCGMTIALSTGACVSPQQRTFDEALRLYDAGRYAEAIPLLDKVVAEDPAPWVYTIRGQAYLKLTKYKQAIEDFGAAIKRDANYAPAFKGKGITYLKQGENSRLLGGEIEAQMLLEQAVQDLTFATRYDDKDPQSFGYLGKVYQLLGEEQKAFTQYERAVQLLGPSKQAAEQPMDFWEKNARMQYERLKPKYRPDT